MFALLELLRSLPADARRRLALILAGIALAAIGDAVAVALIVPFLGLVANSNSPTVARVLAELRALFGVANHGDLVVLVGLLSLTVIVASGALNALMAWAQVRFANDAGFTISRRLLDAYAAQEHRVLLNRNSAEMGKNILSEVDRLISGAFTPALTLVSRGAAALCIVGILMWAEPLLAVVLALLFGGIYVAIYLMVSKRLARIGAVATQANEVRYRIVNEAFVTLRELRLYGRVQSFIGAFDAPALAFSRANASSLIVGQTPKYILEPMAFGGLVLTVVYVMRAGGDLAAVLPLVGLFGFGGYRLIPAFQNIFIAFSTVRYYVPAIEMIVRDLRAHPPVVVVAEPPPLKLVDAIRLRDVGFAYDDQRSVFERLDLAIPANSTVGLVGRTGAGKTTLVSLLLGLVEPTAGSVTVDGRPLAGATRVAWQRGIGYVPQDVVLTDDTLGANIALGVPSGAVDLAAVERAARLAHLHDFAAALPDGYRTMVGERGSHLSGGQRQRIGIARALYHEPQVIVFDEATSALDSETERAIVEAIEGLAGSRTLIIVSHRPAMLRHADVVHMIDGGRIAASGPPEQFAPSLGGGEAEPALTPAPV